MSRSTSRQRFNMLLMTVFGVSALLLAAIGIYGLMSYSVQQRTQEIGIRMALGAQPRHVLSLIVRHGMRLTLAGIALGLAAAFGVQVTAQAPAAFSEGPWVGWRASARWQSPAWALLSQPAPLWLR